MDISLHSFILVIGIIVIGFIIWDGVKKVRAARANRLDQSLMDSDTLDVLADDELPKFDDLEIKDELLQDALKQQVESKTFESELKQELEEQVQEIEAPNPVIEEDGFEHFSAKDDDDGLSQPEPVIQSAQPEPEIDPEVQSQPKPAKKPQRKSKEELAAKLAEAKAQANAQIEIKEPVTVEEVAVDEKEPVPVLMEPVELGQKVEPNPPKQHELVLPELIQQTLIDEPVLVEEPIEAIDKADPIMEYIEDVQAMPVGEKLSEREAAQEIFVINILKQDGSGLLGKDLNHVFSACDMRFGEMNIFHRFEKANAQGKIQFSVANAIQPGTFDMATIDELVTPGISLFMSLPGPEKPMEAFDAMAEVALVFARNFDATLHDDTHSDLTPQTLEHYRNRIREFTRKHLSHKK